MYFKVIWKFDSEFCQSYNIEKEEYHVKRRKEGSTKDQTRIFRNVVVLHCCDESKANPKVLEDVGLKSKDPNQEYKIG